MANLQMPAHGRLERRYSANILLNLTCAPRKVLAESAYTENISANGARILSARNWALDEKVQVECIRWDFRSLARVAYCQPLPHDKFAVGLQFIKTPADRSPEDSPWPPLTR